MVRIKANNISDIERDPKDEMCFIMKYDTFGILGRKTYDIYITEKERRDHVMKNIKRFLRAAKEEESKVNQYPKSSVHRNILADLKSLFIG